MKKFSGLAVASLLVLSGCAQHHQPAQSLVTPPEAAQPVAEAQPVPEQGAAFTRNSESVSPVADAGDRSANVQQCRKELDAMRMYSQASYNAYLAEFQKVGAQTNKYLQIKDSIGSDINDLIMPRYQFQIRELCFRIKTRLTQLIIRQAG